MPAKEKKKIFLSHFLDTKISVNNSIFLCEKFSSCREKSRGQTEGKEEETTVTKLFLIFRFFIEIFQSDKKNLKIMTRDWCKNCHCIFRLRCSRNYIVLLHCNDIEFIQRL